MSNPLFIKAPFLTRKNFLTQTKQTMFSVLYTLLSFATSDSSLGIKNSRYSINRLFLTSKELLV